MEYISSLKPLVTVHRPDVPLEMRHIRVVVYETSDVTR